VSVATVCLKAGEEMEMATSSTLPLCVHSLKLFFSFIFSLLGPFLQVFGPNWGGVTTRPPHVVFCCVVVVTSIRRQFHRKKKKFKKTVKTQAKPLRLNISNTELWFTYTFWPPLNLP
jgi:hypothetical protein